MKKIPLAILITYLFFSNVNAQPNLVLIVTDNQSPNLMGAYGNKDILTPKLDTLATEGILFERAYAVSGVCSPTRATLLTGLLPSQTGVHNGLPATYPIKGWSAISEFRTLPKTLSDAGYNTSMIGKYHLGDESQPQLGFDDWIVLGTGLTSSFYGATVRDNGKEYKVDQHLTDFWTAKGVEFIKKQNKEKPFFLYLSYNGPYSLPPLILQEPKNRYSEFYKDNPPSFPQKQVHPFLREFAIAGSSKEHIRKQQEEMKTWKVEDKRLTGETRDKDTLPFGWLAIDALNNETAMRNLASQMSMVDDGVGKVLEAIRARGLEEDTIVVFTSDHGAEYGQHGLWGNGSWSKPSAAYNDIIQVPLIVKFPGKIAQAIRRKELINQFDIFPTLLELVGMKDLAVDDSPGRSFVGLMKKRDNNFHWDNTAFYEHIVTRVIVKPDWKYVKRLFGAGNELYHLANDNEERLNLVDDIQYQEIQKNLDIEMESFFKKYSTPEYDPWRGGSAKAVLMYAGENEKFRKYFPNWISPKIEASEIFSDLKDNHIEGER